MDTKFVSITVATRYFGLPINWLKAEATAGHIPHLKVGRRMLFDLAAVEQVLFDRAAAITTPRKESQVEARESVTVPP